MAAKTLKNPYRLQTVERTKTKIRKEKPKDTLFNGFGSGISLGWERKSTAERFASRRFWPCTRKISSIGKDQVNSWEFCILKITPTVCFCSVAPLFSAWALAPTYWTIFIRELSILLFSFVNKVEFLSVKGCCVHIINKIMHGCLQIWNFPSRVQLGISLVSCPHSWAIELNTRREIPYLRVLRYYSLFIKLCHDLTALNRKTT